MNWLQFRGDDTGFLAWLRKKKFFLRHTKISPPPKKFVNWRYCLVILVITVHALINCYKHIEDIVYSTLILFLKGKDSLTGFITICKDIRNRAEQI